MAEQIILARLQDQHPNFNVREKPPLPLTKDGKTYFPILLDKDGKPVANVGEGVTVFYDVPVAYAQALFVSDAHGRFTLIKADGYAESVPVRYPLPHHQSEWRTITAKPAKKWEARPVEEKTKAPKAAETPKP